VSKEFGAALGAGRELKPSSLEMMGEGAGAMGRLVILLVQRGLGSPAFANFGRLRKGSSPEPSVGFEKNKGWVVLKVPPEMPRGIIALLTAIINPQKEL